MLRLLLAILLLIPLPVLAQDVPGEVTVNEGFDDSTYESGLTVSDGSIYCNEQGSYGTTGCSLGINNGTYAFEFSEDVYEVGFIVGAVNNSYDVKYYYSDGTDETIQKSGQDNSEGPPWANMYDSFYKSFTDYNNNEANTDKFITKFEVNVTDPTVVDTLYWQYVDESTIPTTTTSTTTTSTTTTTTTTLPPPPPPPTEEEIKAIEIKEAEEADSNFEETGFYETDAQRKHREDNPDQYEHIYKEQEETAIRDEQRKTNEELYGCYMTDAQIERGDCDIIIDDEKPDTKTELPDDDVVVPKLEPEDEIKEPEPIIEENTVEEEIKIDVEKLEEDFKFEEPEIIIEDIPKDIVIIIEDDIVEETPEIPEEVLVEPIQEDVKEEPAEIVEVPVEVIVVEEITEEQVEEVQAVVDTAIANVEELTEEQVEVVAEVLQVPTEDVQIIAEAVKTDEVVAKAVEVYVERAIENKNVENYTLADVVTEIQFEQFIENPIEIFIDIDNIDISTIGDDMTQDQKEKAQEVVVPVILTRIASMAAFIFRRS